MKSLNDDKKYYLISELLWFKIYKSKKINKSDKEIYFSLSKNNIILYLNESEELYFKINGGIIEKSSFIGDKKSRKNIEINEDLSNQNFKFKMEIEILIRLYYYQKELKEKKNSLSFLFNDNKETVYLINKLWIENFENFYEYKKLKLILEQINDSSTLIQNKNYECDSLIEEIISKLPKDFINKIVEKNKNEFDNKPIKYDYNKINDNKREIQYLINNQIINYKIYKLLNSLGYIISNQIKATDLYSIENNEIVLLCLFPNKEITEIGYINNENIFIPEFIIYNDENDISAIILNNFLLNYFSKFKLNINQKYIQFSYINSNIYCYKLNNSMKILEEHNNKVLDKFYYRNLDENEDISANKKIMKYNKYENNELQKKDLELFDKSKKSIKILIFIYLFEKDIEKKIKNSINSMNGEEYKKFIIEDIGYLINIDWMNNFKNIYLYDKIYDYLNKKNSLEIINDYKSEIYNIFFTYKTEFYKIYNYHDLNKNEYKTFPKLSKNELYKNILYYKNFYLINQNIYGLLKKKFFLYDEYIEIKINYIINNGKIIFKFENNDFNNIYIYKQIDNYKFIPEIILYFHSNKNEMDDQYEKFKDNKNLEYDINNMIKNNKNVKNFSNNSFILKIMNDENNSKENNILSTFDNENIFIQNTNYLIINCYNNEINKELKNILSIIIDSEKIKNKMRESLDSRTLDEYYLLNYGWFKKYLELNNINDEIYEYLVKSVKNNIKNISNINMENKMIISKIIPMINQNIKMKIKKEKDNYYKLKDNELFNLDSSSFTIKGNNTLEYYFNFILISPETMKLLNKYFSFIFDKSLILLGDNKAFIKNKSKLAIEILSINNENTFIPELFFCFFDENNFNSNYDLLLEEGYKQYIQFNLLLYNDYASPIFDKNNNNIGYAFKYNPSIKDYSIYQINEQLKAMIKLYFSHAQLKNKLNSKELLKGKYLLFDIEYIQKIKEFFDYNKLEKEINNNKIVTEFMDELKKIIKKLSIIFYLIK